MKSKKLENFFNKKKILITGHSGFTGSWIMRKIKMQPITH